MGDPRSAAELYLEELRGLVRRQSRRRYARRASLVVFALLASMLPFGGAAIAEDPPAPDAAPAETIETPTVEATPDVTAAPTPDPTVVPTPEPTVQETVAPTEPPTDVPTDEPTAETPVEETTAPTVEPTVEETTAPTVEPTVDETTAAPTATEAPTATPTVAVTETETATPEATETETPSPTPTPTATPELGPVTIASDLADYPPGALVTLTGTGWTGDEQVEIFVREDNADVFWNLTQNVSVAEDGSVTLAFNLPSYFVANYSVRATGLDTGRIARSTFTDALPDGSTWITDFTGDRADGANAKDNLYASGGNADVRETLNGSDYVCGEKVTHLQAIRVPNNLVGSTTLVLTWAFGKTTSSGGLPGYVITSGDVFLNGELANLDGNETLSVSVSQTASSYIVTASVGGLEAADQVVVALDPTLACGTTNSGGVIQANLQTATSGGASVGSGAQTVNLNGVNQITPAPLLTLSKTLVNTGGGTATLAQFDLTATGPQTYQYPDGGGVQQSVAPGTYTLSETTVAGYTASAWTCTGTTVTNGNTITLANGNTAACTITNTFQPAAALSISKVVTSVGGSAVAPPSATPSTPVVDAAGDVIGYAITVTNTGNVALAGVNVTDPLLGATLDCNGVTSGSGLPASIIVGGSLTCTGTYSATQADLNNDGGGDGDIDNTASVVSTQTPNPSTASADVNITRTPAVTIVKADSIDVGGVQVDTQSASAPGTVDFVVQVTNRGNVTLTDVVVTDDLVGAAGESVTCPGDTDASALTATLASLAPGASVDCTAVISISQADMDAGLTITNTASVDTAETGPTTDPSDVTIAGDPDISVVKLVTSVGGVAVAGSGSATPVAPVVDEAGDVVTYRIEVTNEGNVTLTGVTVTDALLGVTLDCNGVLAGDGLPFTLTVGSDVSCTGSYVATQADINSDGGGDGDVDNTASATSTQTPTPVTASADVDIDQNPGIELVKTSATTAISAPGTITYSIVVTNKGNTTLFGVVVTDTLADGIDCGAPTNDATVGAMAPGDVVTCSATLVVTQDDIDAGDPIVNVAEACDAGEVTCDDDDHTVTVTQTPVLAVSKLVTSVGGVTLGSPEATPLTPVVDEAGDVVTYKIVVTNEGNVTLTGVNVSDARLGTTLDCNGITGGAGLPATIAVGGSITCTGSYVATQADIDSDGGGDGDIDNTASATSTQTPTPVTASADVDIDQNPGIELVKRGVLVTTVVPGAEVNPGDRIDYILTVTNTGNTTLTNIDVTDDIQGIPGDPVVDCGGGSAVIASLAPGDSEFCTTSYTLTAADIAAGGVVNQAIACADADPNGTCDPGDTENKLPSVDLTKTADPLTKSEPGGTFTFTLTITNTSTVEVTVTSLTDSQSGDSPDFAANCDLVAEVLAPKGTAGDSVSCTYTVTHTNAGTFPNTAAVTVRDAAGTTAVDSAQASVTVTDALPTITVDKSANPTSVPETTGGTVTYTFTVTNTSVEPVTIASLSDSKFTVTGDADCKVGTVLAVGASCTFEVAHTLLPGDAPGTYVNEFEATATDNEGNTAKAKDDATVTYTDVVPTITVEKTASPTTVPETTGGSVTYTFKVTNTSAEQVTIASLADSKFTVAGSATCKVGTVLAAGASCTFIAPFTVPAGDAPDTFVNVFSATAKDDENNTASATDDATVTYTDVKPTVTVTKTANPTTVPITGGPVTYTIVVKNDSAEPVTLNSLVDDKFGNLDGVGTCDAPQTIVAGGTYTCSFVKTVVGGVGVATHINVAKGCVSDDETNEACATDDATVTFAWRGRTPGYWKNKPREWPSTYTPGQTLTSAGFIKPACISFDQVKPTGTDSLTQALGYQGGSTLNGKAQILLRAAVAALLNEATFGNDYPPYANTTALLSAVNAALASCNATTIINLATTLDFYNNGIH